LSAHDAIVYDVLGGGTAWTFTKGSTEMSVVADGRLRITAAEGVREAVLADFGLAIASQWMFAPELERGVVRAVRQEWTLPSIDLWAVFPTGRHVSAKARAFVAFVEDVLAQSREHPP
jgi:DNA-binding transcriptional LysR family regulator